MIQIFLLAALGAVPHFAGQTLTARHRCFHLDGRPFPYSGLSFFNALYERAFQASGDARREWFAKFRKYGINVLRVWAQWDNKHTCPESSLYETSGALRPVYREWLRPWRSVTWNTGGAEVRMLLERYGKPVVDDEPARNGPTQFGGLGERTYMANHTLQILEVWKIGAYPAYHYDMFQLGARAASVPPSGIPAPDFSPYHRAAFEFFALRERCAPQACGE